MSNKCYINFTYTEIIDLTEMLRRASNINYLFCSDLEKLFVKFVSLETEYELNEWQCKLEIFNRDELKLLYNLLTTVYCDRNVFLTFEYFHDKNYCRLVEKIYGVLNLC